jgi:hypothetical protein
MGRVALDDCGIVCELIYEEAAAHDEDSILQLPKGTRLGVRRTCRRFSSFSRAKMRGNRRQVEMAYTL